MEVIKDSLFYTGGTINTEDCINTVNNYKLAFNIDYLFVLDNKYNIIASIKYQEFTGFAHNVLKTKIKIDTKSEFLKNMQLNEGMFYSTVQKIVINEIIKNNKNNRSVINILYQHKN